MKKNVKQRSAFLLAIFLVLTLFFGYITVAGIGSHNKGKASNIRLGLDLAGGVSITYEVNEKKPSQTEMDDTIYKIQQRVTSYSTESSVYQEGVNRINVEIPGVSDANKILEELGKPGSLNFMTEDGKVVLTGSDITTADAQSQETNAAGMKENVVVLELTPTGAKKFADATGENIGKSIAIVYDNQIISNPVVQSKITQGSAVINGMANYEEAEKLASTIRIGALPLELKEIRSNVVGAQLGKEAISTSLKAGAIGFALVCVFMMVVYLFPGVIASMALIAYIILMLLFLNVFNVTLTLPGIAGIILSIGMAVDANVIIFTRIKEELGTGKSLRSSIKSGFEKALSAIVDGNITTLIAAAVLYIKGSGTIKGFATTLAIGIVLSMFTALVITKLLVNVSFNLGFTSEKLYGTARKVKERNYVKMGKVCGIISVAIIALGFIFMPINNAKTGSILNYSLEFKGGTATTITFDEGVKLEEVEADVVALISKETGEKSPQSQKVKDNNQLVVKTKELTVDQREAVDTALKKDFKVTAVAPENISSSVSNEMKNDALVSVIIATICMLIYIAFRFKDIKFGASAVVALLHDVLIVLTVYSVARLSVGNTFIACMLTIVGYSINATIIIFDRIRENLKVMNVRKDGFEHIVNTSISQTFTRTINTSLTTFIMVFVLFIMGVPSIKEFAITLMAGIVCGAYSSVCITGPMWYFFKKHINAKK